MDIGEVVKQSGLSASTLRFYEEKGLIQSTGRNGLRRIFAANVLERLALIALGRSVGFALDEIAGMFAEDGRLDINRQQLLAKADELNQKVKQLSAMRDGLRHAADCSAPSHLECSKFQRILRVAGTNRYKPESKLTKKTP